MIKETMMKENNNKNSVELCVLCGEPEAVILANGDYPTHPIPLQILAYAPYIICCDGGANAYIDRGNVPDVIIGDGDSLSEENRRKYSHILLYLSAKALSHRSAKAVSRYCCIMYISFSVISRSAAEV